MLRESNDLVLKRRRLSIANATTIALALKHKAPIIIGDIDLTFIARKMGVEIIW